MDDRKEDRVRTRAYELWEKEGRPHGKDKEHWVEAEREHSAQQQAGEARPGGQEQQAQAEEETIGTVAEVPVVRRKRAAAPRQTSTRQTSTRRTTKSG